MTVRDLPKPTILLTGATGQIGFELVRILQGLGRVVAFDRAGLDLSDIARIEQVVSDIAPAVIVNAAAYTAVDAAETDVAGAMRLNAEAPEALSRVAKRLGALLVHYSTDYVFDGVKPGAYVEDDATNPLNVYGVSKLAGEQAIAASGCAYLVFRTSWVYGAQGTNFLRTMLRLAAERDELSVVNDQIGAPTWSRTIADETAIALSQLLRGQREDWFRRSGVYHLTAAGSTSWAGFAQAIFDNSRQPAKPVIKGIPTISHLPPTVRPLNSRLSNGKLADVFGIEPPPWDEALRQCMAQSQL
ncbi:dTDP-4-dehydrorhamnose reductase [Caballeronia sp. DA-9]|uniref:dTDP-4-dehydrorhamnose reductase n=1 Tax=Caballeronia sp. DA-9 TaxID=3436237 RepID=UPI003F66A88B